MVNHGKEFKKDLVKKQVKCELPTAPKLHELKTDPEVFDAMDVGDKSFEIRFNDRDFKVGDILLLRRTLFSGAEMKRGKPLVFTGETLRNKITYILKGPVYGLESGWVVMSVIPEIIIDL